MALGVHRDCRLEDVALWSFAAYGAAIGRGRVHPDVVAVGLAIGRDADLGSRLEEAAWLVLVRLARVKRRGFLERAVVEHEAVVVVGVPFIRALFGGRLAASIVAAELFGDIRRIGVLRQDRQVRHLLEQAFERALFVVAAGRQKKL